MEQQKNHGILIYTDYRDKVRRLTLEEAGRLFLAIMDYAADGTEAEISPAADMCFSFIISQYERDQEKYKRICEKRAEAGRRGAAARAAALAAAEEAKAKQEQQQKEPEPQEPQEPEKPPEQTQMGMEMEPPGEPEQEPEKPKRQKKPKKETFGDFVQMTVEEYNKLLSQYGPERTERMITVLDNYKGATGKKYKDDYRAILNWVVQRVDEEFQKRRGGDGAAGSFGPSDGFRGY